VSFEADVFLPGRSFSVKIHKVLKKKKKKRAAYWARMVACFESV